MNEQARETLRHRLERALDSIERLRPTAPKPALQPVAAGSGRNDLRQSRRTVRPVRAWSRLVRI